MKNEHFVRLYQKKASRATRGHTREMYRGLALLGRHFTSKELERQLREELLRVRQEEGLKPDFCRISQRLLKQAIKDLKQTERGEDE